MTSKLCVIPSYPIPQVVQRIKAVDNETRLLVVDHETHESLRSLRLTATEEMAVLGTGPASSSSPQPSPSPPPASVPSSPSKKRENGSVSKQPVTPSGQVQKPTRRSPSKAAKKVSGRKCGIKSNNINIGTTIIIIFVCFLLSMRTVQSVKFWFKIWT